MVHDDNPAGRLWNVLSELRQLSGSHSVEQAWDAVIGSGGDDVELQIGFAAVGSLVVDMQNQIWALRHEIDSERWISYVPRWTRFVGRQSRDGNGRYSADSVVTQDELDALSFLADLLHHRNPEGQVDREATAQLLSDVTKLLDEVVNADDLDPQFRAFLLEHLQLIESALRHHRIYGPTRFDEIYGRVPTDAARRPERWKSHTGSRFWEPFRKIIEALPGIAAKTGNVNEIAQNAQKFLEITSGGGGAA